MIKYFYKRLIEHRLNNHRQLPMWLQRRVHSDRDLGRHYSTYKSMLERLHSEATSWSGLATTASHQQVGSRSEASLIPMRTRRWNFETVQFAAIAAALIVCVVVTALVMHRRQERIAASRESLRLIQVVATAMDSEGHRLLSQFQAVARQTSKAVKSEMLGPFKSFDLNSIFVSPVASQVEPSSDDSPDATQADSGR